MGTCQNTPLPRGRLERSVGLGGEFMLFLIHDAEEADRRPRSSKTHEPSFPLDRPG